MVSNNSNIVSLVKWKQIANIIAVDSPATDSQSVLVKTCIKTMSTNMIMECIMYADGPGSSKRRTAHTMAEKKQPQEAMRIRRFDHVEGYNEQGRLTVVFAVASFEESSDGRRAGCNAVAAATVGEAGTASSGHSSDADASSVRWHCNVSSVASFCEDALLFGVFMLMLLLAGGVKCVLF